MSRRITRTVVRNKGGRPRSATPRAKAPPHQISVTAETHAAIKAEANRRGVTLAQIVTEFVAAAEGEN